MISIPAPAKGATCNYVVGYDGSIDFNSRPREGGDSENAQEYAGAYVHDAA